MKPFSLSVTVLALAASTLGAFAATTSTNAAPTKPKAPAKQATASTATPAPAPAAPAKPQPAPATAPATPACPVFEAYLVELTETLALSDGDKETITEFYVTDGATLKKDLNDASLSALQKADHASSLRDTRNGKIEALLQKVDRKEAFKKVEAKYRVALTEEAADKGLVAPAPPPAPAK